MKPILKKLIFLLILTCAFILRFYELGNIPQSLDWDEISNSYNAYSILKTGKDEYGKFLPLSNRSFDDYKPPAYMYLDVISIRLFGINNFSSRFPSAFLGFLTVPVLYFLTKKLFKSQDLALMAMFFLAISPWHIQFSRVGFEANVGLFFTVASVCAIFYAFSNYKFMIAAAILLALSLYSYHSQRVFMPILCLGLIFLFKKEIFNIPRKFLLSSAVIFLLLVIPLVVLNPRQALIGRFSATSSEESRKDLEKSTQLRSIVPDSIISRITTSSKLITAERYLGNYLTYFDPNFLFIKGDDNFRHHIEGFGMLYLFELPAMLYGLFLLIKNRSKEAAFVLFWLVAAPIAAIPATPNPHAIRSLPMVIALGIITSFAFWTFLKKQMPYKKIIVSSICLIVVASVLVYLHDYYTHYPLNKPDFWQYGYSQAVLETEKIKDEYGKVYVSGTLEQAYIFWLYYSRYDPQRYQQTNKNHDFDKYYFNHKAPLSGNELYVSSSETFPPDFVVVKSIDYPNGSSAIKIGHPK